MNENLKIAYDAIEGINLNDLTRNDLIILNALNCILSWAKTVEERQEEIKALKNEMAMLNAVRSGDGVLMNTLQLENQKLRNFAQAVMDVWPDDIDGADLQDIAVDTGMLAPVVKYESCGKGCACAESMGYDEWAGGITCYRKTELLLGKNE